MTCLNLITKFAMFLAWPFLLSLVVSLTLNALVSTEQTKPRRKRVVGGTPVEPGKYPWLVKLDGIFCGGVLIDPQWVLTAAHCFTRKLDSLEVWLNTTELDPSRSQDDHGRSFSSQPIQRTVEKIIIHQNFSYALFLHDLALLKLVKPVDLDPVRMPWPGQVGEHFAAEGERCLTMGWGCTENFIYEASNRSKEVVLPIFPNHSCSRLFEHFQNETLICAGYEDESTKGAACGGDSGGPLLCMSRGQYTLAGIISFGDMIFPSENPVVCTKVQLYLPWIRAVLDEY